MHPEVVHQIVRCIGSSSLRVNHKQGTQLGLVPLLLNSHLLLLFCSSSPLSLLAAMGHGRALPSACSAQWIGFLRGRGLGQSLERTSAQGFHPLILLSTTHWGDSPGVF